ncbi:sensor histidine kinase [Aurantimonas sp. HBX-1]|uniref:sensor histidine kinase n=1 Tax=Aurantimonas sp. HBX-1 TaxID=2906072 RepID=UPI001F27DF2F|nr:sensor histidine kinase [Aurantimonas sp. HBX-1]UIJ70612.1 sensor histidine kinase [Aurantimonas sp. HBX-1]
MSLAWQFLLAGMLVLFLGMTIIGLWVTDRIEEAATRNAAVATALYVDSIIAPLTQELANRDSLGEGAQLALRETLGAGVLGDRLVSFKIWAPDGTIIYANEDTLVGQHFEPEEGLSAALAGRVHGEFDSLDDPESAIERRANIALLEIYSPIREPWSGRVIGVAEFYETAEGLSADIAQARVRSWLVVGVVTAGMLGSLFLIVARGSRMIIRQRTALKDKVEELSQLLSQNRMLRLRVEQASQRAAGLNERYLRRISADLHDGPAQLLAYALLRLDMMPERVDLRVVQTSLDEAMQEIRDICRGLTLPELDALDLDAVLRRAVSSHVSRTGTVVSLSIDGPTATLSQAEKICVYRFVQETLNNATRHAAGASQVVEAITSDDGLTIAVRDDGPGFDRHAAVTGLGLAGLEERVVQIGGRFDLDSTLGRGTTVKMMLSARGVGA